MGAMVASLTGEVEVDFLEAEVEEVVGEVTETLAVDEECTQFIQAECIGNFLPLWLQNFAIYEEKCILQLLFMEYEY